jgi:hypothetical protein
MMHAAVLYKERSIVAFAIPWTLKTVEANTVKDTEVKDNINISK